MENAAQLAILVDEIVDFAPALGKVEVFRSFLVFMSKVTSIPLEFMLLFLIIDCILMNII